MSEKRFEYIKDIDKIGYWEEGMRYELDVHNLEDVVITLNTLAEENEQLKEVISENEKMLQNDLDMLTKLRRENKKKDIEIKSLNSQIKNWCNESKIAKLYENEQYRTETLEKEYEQLAKKWGVLSQENIKLRHELDSLSGCYCADNKEFKDYWRIGYDD